MAGVTIPDVAATAVAISPWVSDLRKLSELHFKPPEFEQIKEINNAFATLFSAALYLFVSQSPPDYLIRLWPWWSFMLWAFVFSLIVHALLLWGRYYVETMKFKWPLFLHTIVYTLLFCSITMGFGLLKLLEDHVYLVGTVIEIEKGSPVKNPSMLLYDADNKITCMVTGDPEGRCETLIKKETYKSIQNWRLEVSAEGYNTARVAIVDSSSLLARWRKVRLRQQQN